MKFPVSAARRHKKTALIFAGVLLGVLLLLRFGLPVLLQTQAEKFIAAKTGHRLTMARPEFNPLTLSLTLADVRLSDPQDAPLLAFDRLLVDVSIASLPRRGAVFDAVRLDGLQLTLVEEAGGRLNWLPFIAAFADADKAEANTNASLPRLDIAVLTIAGGHIDLADRRNGTGFATRIEPVEFSLSDVSTQPDDTGRYSLSALTGFGAQLRLAGDVGLNPFNLSGAVTLENLRLDALASVLTEVLQGVLPAAPSGRVDLTANYRLGQRNGQADVQLDDVTLKLADLRLPLSVGGQPVVAVKLLELAGGSLDLAARQIRLGKLALQGGGLSVLRDAQGRIDLLAAVQALTPVQGKPTAPQPAWHYRIDKAALADWRVTLRDESLGAPLEIALENLAAETADLSDDLAVPLPVQLAFDVASGGHFTAVGKLVPASGAAELDLQLAELSLRLAQPLLAAKTTLNIADGRLSTRGHVRMDDKGPAFSGQFDLNGLRIVEADGDVLLAWKSLAGQKVLATAQQIGIGEVRLSGIDSKLIVEQDKTLNLHAALKKVAEPAAQSVSSASTIEVAPPAATSATASPLIKIDRLRFYGGSLYFADHSLVLPFGTRIHELRGSLSNLSSRPGAAHSQLELEGEVDDYGMARAVGQLDAFDPTGFMDLRVLFRNVDMPRLTPYTATFAGRKIDSGKLSLDLQYKIVQRQLHGENQVTIDRLTLGERVSSPDAADLPLDLAIALLQDADGRIDLGLPVTGSLDDPQFSYGTVVWKAIRNVLGKIVTAPFRALASLFGGSEPIEGVVFEAGQATLLPPEREKLVRVAQAVAKRPRLQLALAGLYAEADRVAMQDVQLRRELLTKTGARVNEKYDPGPVSTAQVEIRRALEDLYAARIGAADLAALKEGFRQANPGQLEEGVAGRMMSRLSGLLREKKTLEVSEIERLKGGDFYAILFERLRARMPVSDAALQALAQARSDVAMQVLKEAGVDAERLQALAVEAGEGTADGVPLKLAFANTKKTP